MRAARLDIAAAAVAEGRGTARTKEEPAAVDLITPRLLTLVQAARYSSFSYWTIRDLVISGRLPRVQLPRSFAQAKARDGSVVRLPVKDGSSMRAIRIDRQDLDRLIDSCKSQDGG
jgi:hypothetical protein